MTDGLAVPLALAYAYLVGSIPSAYLAARLVKGIDIRRYGSGTVGASNVAQHVGKGCSIAVALFDGFGKGTGSVVVARVLGLDLEYQVAAALLTVVGHNWSIYLKLSGGRGIAVTVGCLLPLAWKEMVALVGVSLLGWAVFRSTALWVGLAMLLLPMWAVLLGEPLVIVSLCAALLVLAAAKRLLSNPGTALPGLRWRDMALPRLLYDRDTRERDGWVTRTPGDPQGDDA